MTESSARPAPSFFRSWVLPIVLVGGIAAGVAYPISRSQEWSYPVTVGVVLLVFFAIVAWTLLTFSAYESAAKSRGWRCETGPTAESPSSDVRIEGTFEGTHFTLTRHKVTSPGRRIDHSSALEWSGGEIRVPAFTLHVRRATDAAIDRVVGAGALIGAIRAAAGHAEPAPIALPQESALGRRAELTSPDAAAAGAFFSSERCAVLDPLLTVETIDATPGRITILAMGFPSPQGLDAHLARGAAVRRALVS